MPRSSKISWNDRQVKELRRQVKRFNAKITRTARKSPELVDFLPDKLSVKQLRQTIKNANDLKLISARVDRAFKKGAFQPILTEQGVRTTKYEVREISLGVQRINRRRAKELAQANPNTEKGTMGTVRENNLQPKRFNPNSIKQSDWDKFVQAVERQSMNSYTDEKIERYKENYLRALQNAFGASAEELIEKLRNVPAKTIYQQFYDNPNLQIGFIYDPLEASLILETLNDTWGEIL